MVGRTARIASLGFALSLVTASCASSRTTSATAPPLAASAPAATEVRGADAAFAHMHASLEERVDAGEVAGAVVLLARGDSILYRDAVGYSDMATREPMRTDALFRIGSMTKPVTSVAIMMLIEEGRLRLSDPISTYLPEFSDPSVLVVSAADSAISIVPAEREITVQDLLTHRSGISYGFIDAGPVGDLYRRHGVHDGIGPTRLTLAENVRRLAAQPLGFHPGQRHGYGLNLDVAGRLVEVVSGQRLSDFLRERIFGPLGMHDTWFYVPDEELSRLATPYTWTSELGLQVMADSTQLGDLLIGGVGYRGSSVYLSGGAGLISTADDYMRFLQMMLGGGSLDGTRILSPETVALMTRSYTEDLSPPPMGARLGMGIGFVVVTSPATERQPESMGSYTQPGIYGTTFWVDPHQELIGIVMIQRHPFWEATIDDVFKTLAYRAVADSPALRR